MSNCVDEEGNFDPGLTMNRLQQDSDKPELAAACVRALTDLLEGEFSRARFIEESDTASKAEFDFDRAVQEIYAWYESRHGRKHEERVGWDQQDAKLAKLAKLRQRKAR